MLVISTVVPSYVVSTSPGRKDAPPTMFSASAAKPLTRIGSSSRAMVSTACTMAAAPAMSSFIVGMLAAGLMVRPPESNVMPLPTSARCVVASTDLGGRYSSSTRRGGASDPDPTARMPPQPSSASWASSKTLTLTPTTGFAAATISSAKSAGVRSPGGVLTQSRAATTASAISCASSNAAIDSLRRAVGESTTISAGAEAAPPLL